jgi:hypothetical protein
LAAAILGSALDAHHRRADPVGDRGHGIRISVEKLVVARRHGLRGGLLDFDVLRVEFEHGKALLDFLCRNDSQERVVPAGRAYSLDKMTFFTSG